MLKIIVIGHNVQDWIHRCITSIQTQTFTDFKCVIVDDCSTDNTGNIIYNDIRYDSRFISLIPQGRRYTLQNIVVAIKALECNDDDIVIQIDGDDWLYTHDVLEHINTVYENDSNIWMTYGQFITHPESLGRFCNPFTSHVVRNKLYRSQEGWPGTQLRTFKYFLWKNIKDSDLRDTNGQYYTVLWDMAIGFPMFEMCQENNIKFITKTLYVYNIDNPLSDCKKDNIPYKTVDREIREKPVYNTLMRE